MSNLLLGLLVFLGVHSLRVFLPGLRYRLMTAWGPLPYKGAYSLISLLGLWWLITGYSEAKL